MTKERLKVMTILDIMFIIAFGYSTIASWGVYESYYTITYFAITVFLMAIMCDRIYCYIHKNVTDKTKEKCMYHCGVQNIKIKYFDNEIDKIEKINIGDWIDLRSAETVHLKKGEFYLIPLGVGMKLPDGYEANVVPRSSTYKNFKVLQTNSFAVIDNSYSGDNDQWLYPVVAIEDTVINKNDRICQFRINKIQPEIEFEDVEHLNNVNRGGIGSTGIN